MHHVLEAALSHMHDVPDEHITGEVRAIKGLLIEAAGLHRLASIGMRCEIQPHQGASLLAEVIGIREHHCLLMPYGGVQGIGVGSKVTLKGTQPVIYPEDTWKGRVINALGEPIDDLGTLPKGDHAYKVNANPPPAHKRKRLGGKIDLGVRAMNSFLSCCRGQRMGIFAGSGVGKSMLVSMLTKFSEAEVKVIGLVGERGREVQEFIHEYLGEEGLKQAVIVVATSDESALMRRQAAYTTMAVAEYFRDQGKDVLCLMDSVTRFAMAQREIGLSAGEPPATRGYTPTVFVELPRLLERAGPGIDEGTITGLFTVLVDGDDHNEPISDAVRGILDGHVVLDRTIAERGRYPAINILRSVSRTMPGCNSDRENQLVTRARQLMSTYDDMAELIRLGAYRKGSDPQVDEAIRYQPALEAYLEQEPGESCTMAQGYTELEAILQGKGKAAAQNPQTNQQPDPQKPMASPG